MNITKWSLNLFMLTFIFGACKTDSPLNEPGSLVKKPNIIFIMSDDQGYADLGCYGSEFVKTPILDKMAEEGMRFTQVYAGSPVCAPTRNVLMTGKHSGHITRRDNRASHEPNLPFGKRKLIPLKDEDITVGEVLKEAGYITGMIGKWGLGNPGTTGVPEKQGFDHFFGYQDQVHAHDYYSTFLMRNGDTLLIPENENNQRKVYTHDLLAEDALDFIRKHKEEPFFLYLPLTLPHGRYEIPDNSLYADQDWPEQVKNYAAMISLMDKDISRIFDLLKELKLDENTIVFFTSDHGPNPPFVKALDSNKPFRGNKRQVLEGGLRSPMIVRWPGKVPAGVTSDFIWSFWDVLPTLAEIGDASTPEGIDGRSVLPTLLGEKQSDPEFLYWEFYSPFQQAVRLGDWKGIRLGVEEPIYLFNLQEDIKEKNNVASKHPKIVKKMEKIMRTEHEPNEYWPMVKKAGEKTAAAFGFE